MLVSSSSVQLLKSDVELWQRRIAASLVAQKPALPTAEADAVAARAVGWLLVASLCARPGVLPRNTRALGDHLRSLDEAVVAALFGAYDDPAPWLVAEDSLIDEIVGWLVLPDGPCQSSGVAVELLGHVYEHALGRSAPRARK